MIGFISDDRGEYIQLSLIDAAVLSIVRSGDTDKIAPWLAKMILPSHLLRVARQMYDDSRHSTTIDLCRQALARSSGLSRHGIIEANRLLGLSYARLGNRRGFEEALAGLAPLTERSARRDYHFLSGFYARLQGKLDSAEEEYRKAYQLDMSNYHVLRELAQIYLVQERFDEAERYSTAALKIIPTNEYIVDIAIAVKIGIGAKNRTLARNVELVRLLEDLRELGEMSGRSFYENRMATYLAAQGKLEEALEFAKVNVEKSRDRFSAYYTLAQIKLKARRLKDIEDDIKNMQRIMSDPKTGEGKTNKFLITKICVLTALEKGDFKTVRLELERDHLLPVWVRKQLQDEVVKSAAFFTARGNFLDRATAAWVRQMAERSR